MASPVHARRWHAAALHVKSTGQSVVVAQVSGAQRWVGPQVSPAPHEASVVQPGTHDIAPEHVHGTRMQMAAVPPSAGQSASPVHVIIGT
jgi:hypothetical protein